MPAATSSFATLGKAELRHGFQGLVAAAGLPLRGEAPPDIPSADALLGLADAFERFRGQGGLLLEHQYTMSSLARHGLRALKGHDRAIAAALLTASALMGEDGLELTVARATRVVEDHPDSNPWSEERYPQLQVSRLLFRVPPWWARDIPAG